MKGKGLHFLLDEKYYIKMLSDLGKTDEGFYDEYMVGWRMHHAPGRELWKRKTFAVVIFGGKWLRVM